MCLGGTSVPVYQDVIARELVFVLNHAETAVVVAEDQEQVDKILSLKDQLPALRLVVYDDPRGISRYRFDWLKSFEEVVRLGRDFGREHPGLLRGGDREGSGRRRGAHLLHLGHDRQPQGRHADPRQRPGRRDALRKGRGRAPRRRTGSLTCRWRGLATSSTPWC